MKLKYSTSPIRENLDKQLDALYERRRTVENLIHSLQQYSQESQSPQPPSTGAIRANAMGRRRLAS